MRATALLAHALLALGSSIALSATDSPQRLARLEAGVQAEESIRAIKRLQNAYGHYLEAGRWNDVADLFAHDATARFQTGETVQADVSGQTALRKHFMSQAGRSTQGLALGQLNVHLILQPIVTLGADGKTAKGTWHEVAMLGQFGTSASWAGGVYENEYVQEKGVWKIQRLHFFQQYAGPYDAWGHTAPAKWNIPYHFEAAHVGMTIPREAIAALTSTAKTPSARDLTRRVRALNDETQIRNLQHSFGYYLDRKLWDDVADLFVADGSLDVGQGDAPSGPTQIRRGLEALYGAPPLRHGELFDHINLATVVTIAPDGQSARARTSQLGMIGVVGEFARWELGTLENEFVRQDDLWKLRRVRYFPRFSTDYDAGWARGGKPGTQSADFHFQNPVTGRVPRHRAPIGRVVPQIVELEQRLAAEVAVDAVENLNSSYGYYIDESAWDHMADTFASNGSKEITGAGVYVGPDRIRKVLNLRGPRGGRTASFYTIHQLTQPVIHVSPDGRSARARMRLFQCGGSADGSSGAWIGGIYENTAYEENGEWKFGAQQLYHIYNASYKNGWARVGAAARAHPLVDKWKLGRDVFGGGITQGLGGASSGSRIATEMPPDRPIVARQYAFPDIVEPPFHYRNPVSGRMPAELLPALAVAH